MRYTSWLTKGLGVLLALLGSGVAIYIVTTDSCNVYHTSTATQDLNSDALGPWQVVKASGKDSSGRTAEFLVAVLAQEHRWKFRKTEILESGRADSVLPPFVASLPEFEVAQEVIAVGVASQEGGTLTEEERADRRADEILKVVRPMAGVRNLYKLNLGQHREEKPAGDTSSQRRVILIGVMSRPPDMTVADLQEALFDALRDESRQLSFVVDRYSRFTLAEV
jgi:hypothetical protein